jgi:hypothetical protein
MEELEAIAGLAALENRKAAQIELIVRVAREWTEPNARVWLLELAQSAYGLRAAPVKLDPGHLDPGNNDQVKLELIELLNLLTLGTGVIMPLGQETMIGANTWIAMIDRSLAALEQARRMTGPHPLEPAVLEVLEFVKQGFFGRNFNIAERSALRGLYERQKNLRSDQ